MKRTFLALALALTTIGVKAQTDSLSMEKKTHELQEVVVNSAVAGTSAEKSVYLPTRKQRNAATDAVALLQHMMIPEISVDAMTQDVRTIANEEVGIFIDFMPAKKEDLEGMNTQDVKRVEIYDFPKDVRFQNKPHVVNFVMQRYEIGGYTKLSSTNLLATERDLQTTNSAYSKLACKDWTLDASLYDTYSDYKHVGSETETVFRLPAQAVKRTAVTENGDYRTHKPSASLRATYNTERIQLANRLEILYNNSPTHKLSGAVSYSPDLFNSTSFETHRAIRNITPTYTGDWYFHFPKDWALSFSPQLQYSRNEQNRFYLETTQIVNDIKEDVTSFNWNLGLSKAFSEKHSISITNYGLDYHSDLDYTGSTISKSNQRMFVIGQGAEYSFSTEKLNLSTDFILIYQHNKVDGETEKIWYPVASIDGVYSPNERNKVSLFVNYNSSGADDAQLNPSVMQENELMYYCGNPALKNYRTLYSQLQYTWMPTNILTASAYIEHIYVSNYIANTYELYNNGAAIIRRIANAGDSHHTTIGANLTLRLLNKKLTVSAQPKVSHIRTSGLYSEKDTPFSLNLKANYYLGQFYFMAGYNTPKKTYDTDEVAWQRTRSFYYLTAGWGNSHWKARFDIVNPFRTDWRHKSIAISTPLYSADLQHLSISPHQRLSLTLTYTFNYGKKVKQGNELGTASGGQSSIL